MQAARAKIAKMPVPLKESGGQILLLVEVAAKDAPHLPKRGMNIDAICQTTYALSNLGDECFLMLLPAHGGR
jgi:hypothetical protein